MAGIGIDAAKAREFHTDRERNFVNGLARWPELADLLAGPDGRARFG